MRKIFILTILLTICSCSNNKKKEDDPIIPEHDYQEILDKKIDWLNIFKQSSNDYYVYFYFEHCSHCRSIKNEVIDKALNGSKTIYFCNDEKVVVHNYDTSQTIGIKDIELLFINGFPSLIKISQHIVNKNICGSNKVINELRNN